MINVFKRGDRMNSNGRLQEIDIVRGITIFLVVLGHAGISNSLLAEVLGDFRMPLFFVVSGYLFSTSKYLENTKRLIKEKFRSLLIPYISFCLMSAAIWYLVLTLQKQEIEWRRPFLGMMYGNGNWIIGNIPVWFLICLFCAFVIFRMVLKYTKKYSPFIRLIIFGLIGIVGYEVSRVVWLPFSFDIALVAILFMFVGNQLKEKRILYNDKAMKIISIISLFMLIATVYFNIKADMNNRIYGNLFWFYIGGISGSFLVLFISKYLLTKSKVIYSIFSYIGRESIIILGFHASLGFIFVNQLQKVTGVNISGNSLLITVIAIGFSLSAGLVLDRIQILSFLFKGKKITTNRFQYRDHSKNLRMFGLNSMQAERNNKW